MATNTIATLLVKIGVDIKGFQKNINTVKRSLRSLETGFKNTARSTSSAVARMDKIIGKSLQNTSRSFKATRGSVSKASSSYKKSMGGMTKSTESYGRSALYVFGAVAAAIGHSAVQATKAAAKFDLEMTRTQTISNSSAAQSKILRQGATNLAMSTGVDANEIAKGMTTMAQMGFSAEKIMEAMPHILDSATVSGEKFSTVLHTIETALSAFHMEGSQTQRVADVLTQSANKTRATIGGLKQVFKYAAPGAHDLGVSLEELAAAGSLMIHAGKEGGIAGRTLRIALQRLASPTEAAQEELSRLGVTISDDLGNMRSFPEILSDIQKNMKGLGNVKKTELLKKIFGVEASSGMLTLVNASEKGKDGKSAYGNLISDLEDSGGQTAEKAKKINNTLGKAAERMQQVMKAAYREIGERFGPAANKLVNTIANLVKGFMKLPEPIKAAIVGITVLTAKFAAFIATTLILKKAIKKISEAFQYIAPHIQKFLLQLARISGVIYRSVLQSVVTLTLALRSLSAQSIIAGLQSLGLAIRAIGLSIWTALGPVGLIIAGIVVAFSTLWATSETFRNQMIEIWGFIKNLFASVWEEIKILWEQNGDSLKASTKETWEEIKNSIINPIRALVGLLAAVWDEIQNNLNEQWANIKSDFENILNDLGLDWQSFFIYLETSARTSVQIIGGIISSLLTIVGTVISTVIAVLKGDWQGAWNHIKSGFGQVKNIVSGTIDRIGAIQVEGKARFDEYNAQKANAQNRQVFGPTFGTHGNVTNNFNISANSVNGRHIQNFMNRKSSSMFGGGF